jgi:predicted dehydrogenase
LILTGEVEAMLFKEGEDKSTAIEVKRTAKGGPVMEASESRAAAAAGTEVGAAETGEQMNQLEPYRMELEAFCSAIKYRTEVPCTGETALAAAAAILKANEAIKRGEPVELGKDLYSV